MSNVNWMTVGLLCVSNLVMLYAWYGHLRSLSGAPAWVAILVSWLIAFVEYCVAVPANRIGAKTMTLEQLKITQEAVTLLVFMPFSVLVMRQPVSWNYLAAAVCIFAAVFLLTSIGLAFAYFDAQSPSCPLICCVICLLFSTKRRR